MSLLLIYIAVIIFFVDYLVTKHRILKKIDYILLEQYEIRNRVFNHEQFIHRGDGK